MSGVEADPNAPATPPVASARRRLHVILPLTANQRSALEASAEANGLTLTFEVKRLILKELSYEARLRGREDFAISRQVWRRRKASGGLTDDRLESEARRILEEQPKYSEERVAWELAKYQSETTKGPADVAQCRRIAERLVARYGPDAGARDGAGGKASFGGEARAWAHQLLAGGFDPKTVSYRLTVKYRLSAEDAERLVAEAQGVRSRGAPEDEGREGDPAGDSKV